ncbi:alpha-ketoglutarate-dependent dioxygenase AlkB [Sphingomonas sp. BAUL-RG-20F-R05-02]|uniref:alpha-ketoglutarate-dependent dioxygenase AlkB n=1 Tax=Sphingomonas sp. BAUL-RG-20F-R05-02 TaxID=2914830 RepID=UPI001F56DD76|nr:alpha-ketoglutarate-dependent dioxygenase AlkB [Sphingomonas sp. BAUL-RG-20F-R05-02]
MAARPQRQYPTLFDGEAVDLPVGFYYLPSCYDAAGQRAILADIRAVLAEAPLFQQAMPKTGAPLSVKMSNAGTFGWVTDREGGYRYQSRHPKTGKQWPQIPSNLLDLWKELTGEVIQPNLCLINFYDGEARLGLHQDKGESSLDAPVVSVSLGDDATFLVGGMSRKDAVRRLRLRSGDVVWFGGPARLIYHGVEGIVPGSSPLLTDEGFTGGGRINLTLRRIERPADRIT